MKHTFRIGGIHPDASKTAARRIVMQPLPMVAVVPLAQHIGAPARPVVAKGDTVSRGQLMAEGASFVSAGLHAPISGVVKAIDSVVMPDGKPAMAIIISASEADHQADTLARQQYWNAVDACDADRSLSGRLSPEQIRSCISDAGIVGLGGAAFPSHVKLSVKPGVKARLLLINGCECEPFLMCDDALMCRWPAHVIEGVELMMKAAGIPEAVIGIEDNKPQAIAALTSKLDPHSRISVVPLKTKYPQ
ncbi:MAG: electron transporter RnfC, partial [Muribaculaceae bacterium]|nr:electron transporter RnfC [Muribaculaceae bacterium]